MIVVDASVWIDLLRGSSNAETRWMLENGDRLRFALTDLGFCEVLQGIRDDGALRKVRNRLGAFQVLPAAGEKNAIAAALNYRHLRSMGISIRSTIDCLIATFCMENGYALLHRDRDFDPFAEHLGLRVIKPL